MSDFQQKVASHLKAKKYCEETEEALEPQSGMAQMLELSDWKLKNNYD